jgi:hypothetical protein
MMNDSGYQQILGGTVYNVRFKVLAVGENDDARKIQGKSRVPHECDVVVLPSSEADTYRSTNAHPRHSSIVIAAECKYYYSNLPFRLSREFLGLCKEMRAVDCYFAVNTSKESVEKVLAYYRCHCETLVLPQLLVARRCYMHSARLFAISNASIRVFSGTESGTELLKTGWQKRG